jgi:hypothetical protein
VVLSGYSGSSTTKTGRHDIAEILLKVVLNTINQSINLKYYGKTSTVQNKHVSTVPLIKHAVRSQSESRSEPIPPFTASLTYNSNMNEPAQNLTIKFFEKLLNIMEGAQMAQ